MKKKFIVMLIILYIITLQINVYATENIIQNETKIENSSNNPYQNIKEKNIKYNKCEKTLENGIYKIAVGRKPNEIMEIAYSSKYNNEKAEIWSDYGNAQAQKFYLEYQKEGFYKITAMHSGKCLTVKDNNIKAGVAIVQNEYQGLDSQKWCLRDSKKNGWVITPLSNPQLTISVEGKIQNGSRLILTNTQDNDNQMFYMFNISAKEKKHENGVYKIAVGRKPNEIMEIAYSSRYNNEKAEIWSDYGNAQAQKFYLEYQKEGYYKITAVHSGKSLTVKDNNIKAGAAIVQYEYQGLDSQKWYLRDSGKNGWIITPLSNPQLAISVEGKIQNGSRLILSKTQDNDNQMFYMFNISAKEKKHENGIYKIAVGRKPNEIMEIAYSSKYNNEKAEIWSDYGNAQAQKFYLEYQKQGYYKITAMHSGKSLTVKNNNIKAGAEIVQNEYQGLDSQKWYLRDSEKNGWIITPLSNPQLAISVEGKIQNGSRLILSNTQDNDNQMFYMFNISAKEKKHENGIYKIAVGRKPNEIMEIAYSSKYNNEKAEIWSDYGNAAAQKFNLEYQKEGYYKITAVHSGKSLTVKDNNIKAGAAIVQNEYQGLDSQKWYLRDSGKNGWVITPLSNPQLAISVEGKIQNGSRLILSNTQDNDNQMFYIIKVFDKNIKEGIYGKSGLMYKGSGGNYLKYYQIGKGNKHIFLNFSIHGFEDSYNYDGQELTYIANQLYNYLKNNISEDLVNKWTVYILPSSNPDGEYNGWTNNGPGRTTLYSWAPGNHGIDMNRCFSVGYTSTTKSARNYNGTQPFQAYEAEALRDFILKNTGTQNIVIDTHGWLNETIGDYEIGNFYRNQFGISKHIYTYGNGYLINWARSIKNTRSMLLELPEVRSHNELLNRNYVNKFNVSTMNLLKNL